MDDCGYSAVLTCVHNLCFEQNYENSHFFTTSLFLNIIYFCFSIFNDSVLSNASFPRFHIKQWL